MSAENVLDIKLCQSKWTEKCLGHILCRQKMSDINYAKMHGQKNVSDIFYVGRKCLRHKVM